MTLTLSYLMHFMLPNASLFTKNKLACFFKILRLFFTSTAGIL